MVHHHHPLKRHYPVRPARIVLAVLGGIILAAVVGLAVGILVKFLWNSAIAAPFGLPVITYWQAVGMFILAKILFSIGHSHKPHDHERFDRGFHHWIKTDCGSSCDSAVDAETFRRFWKEEGREAFETFRQRTAAEDEHA